MSDQWTLPTLKEFIDARLAGFENLGARDQVLQESVDRELRAIIIANDIKAVDANDSLEKYFETVIKFSEETATARFVAQELAILKTEQAITQRFGSVNEFRATLSDQAANFVPRNELSAKIDQVNSIVIAAREQINVAITLGVKQREDLSNRIVHLESKIYLGGAGIIVLLTALQVVFNMLWHH